ncbi:MAG TPA: serine hydrolase [Xanthomonadales bacterium]|nr:serine hydrolase [Xanthomonadales bacterium]
MTSIHRFLSCLFLMLCSSSVLSDPPADFPLLMNSTDKSLQIQMENIVRKQGLWRNVERGELALLLAIVTDPDRPKLAEVNGHKMMYAASLPKIAILFGAAVSLDQGRLQLDDELHDDMVNMIRYSCNDCATRVLELVGRDELIDLLQAPEFDFYDANGEGGLWVGKTYDPRPAYSRDPLYNLSHGATAFQVARFYYRLQTGTLVSPEFSDLMQEALSNPAIQHKFVKGLRRVGGIDMLRKSGTWRDYHADSALVRSRDDTYIIVGLAQNPKGGEWLTQLAEPLNNLVRDQSKAKNRRLASLGSISP